MTEPAPEAASAQVGQLDAEIAALAADVTSLRQKLRLKIRQRRSLAPVQPLHEVVAVVLAEHPKGMSVSDLMRAIQARGRLLHLDHPLINLVTALRRHEHRFVRKDGRWKLRRRP